MLLFDERDKNAINDIKRLYKNEIYNFENNIEILRLLLRLLLRFIVFSAIGASIFIAIKVLWDFSWMVSLILIPVILLLLTLFANSKMNYANHVRVAAVEGQARDEILNKIYNSYKNLEVSCTEVAIVAHSQGGYLAHHILSSKLYNTKKCKEFYGVGSGLIPINIIKNLTGKSNLASILFVLSLALSSLGSAMMFGESLSWQILILFIFIIKLGLNIYIPVDIPQEKIVEQMSQIFSLGNFWNTINWMGLLPYLLSFIIAYVSFSTYKRSEVKFIHPADINGLNTWYEFSSVHDIVGRLVPLGTPDRATSMPIAVGANPLFDHIRYFSKSSPLPIMIAENLMGKEEGFKLNMKLYKNSLKRKRLINVFSVVILLISNVISYMQTNNFIISFFYASIVVAIFQLVPNFIRAIYESYLQAVQIKRYSSGIYSIEAEHPGLHFGVGAVVFLLSMMIFLPIPILYLPVLAYGLEDTYLLWFIMWGILGFVSMYSAAMLIAGYKIRGLLVLALSIIVFLIYQYDLIQNFPLFHFENYENYKVGSDLSIFYLIFSSIMVVILHFLNKYSDCVNRYVEKFFESFV